MTDQRLFGDRQNTYFGDQAAQGILTNPGLILADLNSAVAQADYDLPINKSKDMTRYFIEDPEAEWTDKDNTMCRGAAHPRDLPALRPQDRVGCGWYFFSDPGRNSIGAIGTRNGPALASSLPTGGMWIWNRAEAIKAEDVKQCAAIKSCEFINLGNNRNCAFCAEKGHGVPVNSNGSLKYAADTNGSCGSPLITNASECNRPRSTPVTTNGISCGNYGRASSDGSLRLYDKFECDKLGGTLLAGGLCVRPEDGGSFSSACAGLNIPAAASGCSLDGNLDRECAIQLATMYGFSTSGGFVSLINGVDNNMVNDAVRAVIEAGIEIPVNKIKTFALNPTQLSSVLVNINALARRTEKSDAKDAARYLVDGTAFNPCASYKSEQTGPFKVECLQRAFRKAGCQAGGAKYPSERSAVAEFANLSWSQVNSMFKKSFDDMKSADPRTQDLALKNCLGVGSEFYRERGQTCWKCEDGINTPIRRNAAGDIECASLDGYNCLWQANKEACDRAIVTIPTNLRPLACGEDHKQKYGGSGYDNPTHWCARAESGRKHNGPMAEKEAVMYGPWIGNNTMNIPTQKRKLNNGEVVYLIDDAIYTKMVSENGQEKYYIGKISDFDPNKWNTYTSTPGGRYLIRFL